MHSLKQTFLGLCAVAGLLTVNLSAAVAEVNQTGPLCGARTTILLELKGTYAEKPNAMGLASNGSVIEVLRSEDGSWTIIVTMPNGVSCLLATGEYWQSLVSKTGSLTSRPGPSARSGPSLRQKEPHPGIDSDQRLDLQSRLGSCCLRSAHLNMGMAR